MESTKWSLIPCGASSPALGLGTVMGAEVKGLCYLLLPGLVHAWPGEGGAHLLTLLNQARHLETCGTQGPAPSWHPKE